MRVWLVAFLLAGCISSDDASPSYSNGLDASIAIPASDTSEANNEPPQSNSPEPEEPTPEPSDPTLEPVEQGEIGNVTESVAAPAPVVVKEVWNGKITCALGAIFISMQTCYFLSGSEHVKEYSLDGDVSWVQSAMDYQKEATMIGEFMLIHWNGDHEVGRVSGPPRAHAGYPGSAFHTTSTTYGPQGTVAGQTNHTEVHLRVFPDFDDPAVVYDQEFSVETWFIYGAIPPKDWTIDDGEWWSS